jgi:hypothetical protein
MDDDTRALIAQLYTRIGMIMEDACVVALTIGARNEEERRATIADLVTASARISALIGAIQALDS